MWTPIEKNMIRLIDQDNSNFILNKKASELWKLIDGKNSINYIMKHLNRNMKKNTKQNKDFLNILAFLHKNHLIYFGNLSTWSHKFIHNEA